MLKTSSEAREASNSNSLCKGLDCEVVPAKDTLPVLLKNMWMLQSYRNITICKRQHCSLRTRDGQL